MPYNSIISRSDGQALIPEQVSKDMLERATKASSVLSLFRRIPVSSNTVRLPVLSALPTAYWVNPTDTGLKQTTDVAWANKVLNIEELAVIIPIAESVLADMRDAGGVDVWQEIMPSLSESFGRALDAAVFFGTSAPASFPTNVLAATDAAGNQHERAATAANGGFMADVDSTISLVEQDGFNVNGFVASLATRGLFRAARATDGQRLDLGRLNGQLTELDGLPIHYGMDGLFPGTVDLFAGDWSKFVVGVRQDITVKVLDQAVIQDNTGAIIYNLAQQDMVALRATFRVGWQVANPINYAQPTEANRYPAAALVNEA